MSNWYSVSAPNDDIAVSSRIRLARNLNGMPFPSKMNETQLIELNEKVKKAVLESNTPFAKKLKFIPMDSIPENQVYAMVERHIISREFAANRRGRAIILSDDESISIMVGEEDHIRIQVILGGLQLKEAYDIAERLDTLLSDKLGFAFDDRLGFLTECPTNLGTGLRASVMLHLPLLESNGELAALSESVSKIGFTFRGMYGEGTKALASLYQVSNQITLGISENNALDNLSVVTKQLIEKEREAASNINQIKMEDICYRSLGILQNCRILSSEEMMKHLSRIKMGMSMGIINIKESPVKLLIEGQPYMLMLKNGDMTAEERDAFRANEIRKLLN